MRSNPKPKYPVVYLTAQGPVMKANADGPVRTNFLEMQRGVSRINFELGERFVGQIPRDRASI
jgi:hypothetical protein